MKTWKLINNIFIGEEDNISGIPKKGDIIKIGEDFSYKYKTPFLQSSKELIEVVYINDSIRIYDHSNLTEEDFKQHLNDLTDNVILRKERTYEEDLTLYGNNIHSVEDLSEFEMLEILYNKALENEG